MEIVPLEELSPTDFDKVFEVYKTLQPGITAKLIYSAKRRTKNRLEKKDKFNFGKPIGVIYHDISNYA